MVVLTQAQVSDEKLEGGAEVGRSGDRQNLRGSRARKYRPGAERRFRVSAEAVQWD